MDHPVISEWLPCSAYYDDVFVPANAAPLMRGLHGLDDESAAMTVKLWVMEAVNNLQEQRN